MYFMRFIISQPPKPVLLMPRRIILISYLVLQLDSVFAESTAWNCDKSANNNQWGCTGSSTRSATNPSPKSEEPVEKKVVKPLAPPKAVTAPLLPIPPKATPAPVVVTQTLTNKPAATTQDTQTCAEKASFHGQHCNKTAEKTTEPEEDEGFRLIDPAFDRHQEQVFSRLHANLKADPWATCDSAPKSANPYNAIVSNRALRDTAPVQVDSNYSEIFDKVVTSFSGNVKIDRADQNVLADKVNYNSLSETLDAQGNVFYREDEISMFSDSVLLNLNTDEAHLRDALFISPRSAVRGSAKVVYQENKNFSHYKDVAYTSCRPGNQDWVVHAERFKMNKATGKAAAKSAWLEFKGVPLLYTPYISFPLDDRRMSGFLVPRFHLSGQNGIDTTLPFYWNIAPNYDITFRPRYLAKRGMMLGADFRYMNQMSRNELNVDILPYDEKRNDQIRYQASFKNQTVLSPHMSTNIDLNYVSDKKYISELGNALSFTDIRHVRSIADLNYNREGVDFLTRMENYQTIDQSIPAHLKPYRKLPQVRLDLNHRFESLPVNVGMDNEFVVFQHNSNADGLRFATKPMISAPLKTESGFAIPKASLLHRNYVINKQPGDKDSNISRDLPIFSFDTGLFAEGTQDLFGTRLTHTLEPRLFYLYVPKSSQDDIPIFDTSIYDTNFDSLFRENRFSSVDRVQNANQLTVALTSRFLDNTGRERLKLSAGDIVYFQDRQEQRRLTVDPGIATPYTPITLKETNRFSNIVTEVSGQLNDQFSFSSGLQWNPYTSTLPRKQIDLHYRNKWGYLFNVGYHQRKSLTLSQSQNLDDDIIRQSDVSVRFPIIDNWFAIGRWQYSFLYNKTAESFLGLEKENCCWRFRIIGRHYINGLSLANNGLLNPVSPTTAVGESQTTVMFQIELKSLSGFGHDVDAFLGRSIFGYSDL
jgi:LPS-assembly protein